MVKFALEQATKAQRWSRNIGLLFNLLRQVIISPKKLLQNKVFLFITPPLSLPLNNSPFIFHFAFPPAF